MFGSFFYLPVVQLMFLFDFIGKVKDDGSDTTR